MQKLVRCLLLSACLLLLQGCNPIAERFHTIFTDKDISEQTKLESPSIPTLELDKIFIPSAPTTATETGYITLEQVYAVDGDTLNATAKKSELEAYGINTSQMQGNANFVNITVRYLLIDTPESVHPSKKAQRFAKVASNRNNELLYSGNVRIQFDHGAKVDKYNRLLAYVFVGDTFIQEVLLKEGYARVAFVEEPNTTHLKTLQNAEKIAKQQELNIWSIPDYVTEKGFNDN